MKALVTGGTGFLGAHIARMLREGGHSVRVLHRSTSKLDALAGLDYESALGDVNDDAALRAACAGCDWVFHAAAVADYWRADVKKIYEVNVEGTRRVLEAARAAGVPRVIFTSSAAAVGPRADGRPANESDPFALPPEHFPYGHSKALAETVVQEAVAAGQDVVILNPAVILGPGDLNMISGSFIVQVKRFGALAAVTSGGVMVTDVRDVARWHIVAARKGRSGQRYVLGTQNYPYTQWMGMIAEVVGVGRSRVYVPDGLLPTAATIIDTLRKLRIPTPVDANQVRLGGRKIYFDCSKAWNELGRPQIDMLQSLRDTYAWYAARGYLR
ncbi:MAG: NAD-dependent epimerase/dehydratase family protein [Chloroflexi bacterium]|nr:NAD-dependent epimerase/dehydratase family protein [Chloroflexota bacterium]